MILRIGGFSSTTVRGHETFWYALFRVRYRPGDDPTVRIIYGGMRTPTAILFDAIPFMHSDVLRRNHCGEETFVNAGPIIFGTERRGHQYSVARDSNSHFMPQPKRSRSLYISWERNGRPGLKAVQRRIDYPDPVHVNYRACSQVCVA